MRKLVILLFMCSSSLLLWAQQARLDFKRDISLSASNYVAYPGPEQMILTPAPKGYTPFYISHYGRHGSRFQIGDDSYDRPYNDLMRGDSAGVLTALGKDVLRRVALLRENARGREGELTPLGAEQHKGITRRMLERFPEVFEGETNIDAKSTIVIRCILSMENGLQQLLSMRPDLRITHDASVHDMYYMNFNDKVTKARRNNENARNLREQFSRRLVKPQRLMTTLFTDTAWASSHLNTARLCRNLFSLASNVQSTELRHSLTLYDLFTEDEIYDFWAANNAYWYVSYGPSPLSGGVQPFTQRNLLRKIISEADSCIALPHPGATLRYGHDTMVLPLTCLLDLNGNGRQIEELDQLDNNGWLDYKICPMACNIQFIFYRQADAAGDILFKVLLNENEATLPIPAYRAPYYRWDDFKAYFLKKIADYEATLEN